MTRKIILAIALVALMAAPAFAAVQNVKVSGDIDSTFLHRADFDFGANPLPDTDESERQSVFITQTRLRVDADLSDNVSATIALINERTWGGTDDDDNDTGTQDGINDIDINLAYVTLREMLYSPLTVVIGRQILHYGNGMVIGDGGPNNASDGHLGLVANDLTKRTATDAVKAILDYNPLTIDIFGAKIHQNNVDLEEEGSLAKDDHDLLGINANYQLGDELNTIIEAYFFASHNNSSRTTSTSGPDTIYVPGLRVSTNPISALNLQAEVAMQRGRKAVVAGSAADFEREAMAYQLIANYQLPIAEEYKPMITTSYSHFSGEERADTASPVDQDEWTGWDPMYENQGGGTIFNTLFDLTNSNILQVAGSLSPLEDVNITATYWWLRLDEDITDGSPASVTYTHITPDGTSQGYDVNADEKDLGSEVDVDVTYDYTEDVQFGLSLGWFFPGDVFTKANDETAKQALLNASVAF